jgi:hypothetical protein
LCESFSTRSLAGDYLHQRCLLGHGLIDDGLQRTFDLAAVVVDLVQVELELHRVNLTRSRLGVSLLSVPPIAD